MQAAAALTLAVPSPVEAACEGVEVVLVGEHGLFRAGLAELLKGVAGVAVLGQARTGDEAVALVREHRPDIVMLEAEPPGAEAGSTIARVLRENPRTKVLVLGQDDPGLLRAVVEAGGSGFLAKTAGRTELVAALASIHRAPDGFLLAASRATVGALIRRRNSSTGQLTVQEIKVLGLLAEGRPNRRIADELFISETTVKRHLTNLYRKLGVTSRLHAVSKANQIGLLAAPPAR